MSGALEVLPLLNTEIASIADVRCPGQNTGSDMDECAGGLALVYPYRGVFVRHDRKSDIVAEPNQMLLFHPDQPYRITHPVPGGDGCLSLTIGRGWLEEIAPRGLNLRALASLPVDPRAQAIAAILRHSLRHSVQSLPAEPLEGEGLALTLVRRTLIPHHRPAATPSPAARKLVDRVKLLLASDLGRRWTLTSIAKELNGCSPVYLTQLFQQVERVPLYRYQLRLRLARALDLLDQCEDLTTLALELGFSSHSHFSAAFRGAYGKPPSAFRRAV